MADDGKSTTKKILLGVGGGCLGLVALCCMSGGGMVWWRSASIAGPAEEHAETFLGHLQAGSWAAVQDDIEYDSGFSARPLHSLEQVQACYSNTALADMTSFECDGTSNTDLLDGHADVECTIVSASRGEHEITVHVNNADDAPYNGFTWFDRADAFGSVWAGDTCSGFSGREYYRSPPSNRVRPARSGLGDLGF